MRVVIGLAMLALVAAPASANYLINGDWESGTTSPWTGDASLGLNGKINDPGQLPQSAYYGGVQSVGTAPMSFQQVVTGLVPGVAYTLTGVISGGTVGSVEVRLIGATTAVYTESWTGQKAWHAFDPLSVAPDLGQVTVEFHIFASGTWDSATSLYADNVVLTPEPISHALFALAALPLLRLRRR